SQSSSPSPFTTTRSAAEIDAMSRGDGSNVSTTAPFGTMLVTSTFAPPTCLIMSGRAVVVATTLTAPGAGVGPDGGGAAVEQAGPTNATASTSTPVANRARTSLTRSRTPRTGRTARAGGCRCGTRSGARRPG